MLQLNDFLTMIRQGKNPEQMMMWVLETKMKGTPMGDNLINLARQGNTGEIERIARNLVSQNGMDYDKEFKAFR
jgi:hypothetical protein